MKYVLPCDFQNVDYSCADKKHTNVAAKMFDRKSPANNT